MLRPECVHGTGHLELGHIEKKAPPCYNSHRAVYPHIGKSTKRGGAMEHTGGNILSMAGVTMAFGSVTAIDSLSFSVQQGEIFGFLGPSGAGKTTTIKLLTRQLKPSTGEITVFGNDVAVLSQDDYNRIGIQTDNSGVYERLTVWENLSLFAALKGAGDEETTKALEDVGLLADKGKKAKALSRGMRQRLILARAILHGPALLFLDEPTASLDPGTTGDIHKVLRRLNEGGTTIFLTTHNMEEADKLCDRVAFLHQGHIVEMGTPEALKLKYAKNRVEATMEGGETLVGEKTPEGLMEIARAAQGKAIATIHSIEPNLEEIFLQVTGRELV